MTTEGVRAAAAAFANGNAAIHEEMRKTLETRLRENMHQPHVFLPIPDMLGAMAYRDFIANELNGSGLTIAVADSEVVVIARDKEMCSKGCADYRDRKIKYTLDKFFNSH